MAATDPNAEVGAARSGRGDGRRLGGVLAAALALPGLAAPAAHAEGAPEQAAISFKHLHYEDSQKGLKRITVDAPAIYAITPLGESWSIEGSAVVDSVSGASPRYYTTVSGASKMDDKRVAEDALLTYYGRRSSYAVSFSHSDEHDYASNAASLQARFSSEENNTTFNIGVGASRDTINPTNQIVTDEHKRTWDVVAGLTQALSPRDLAQLQLGYVAGRGYYDDPYKLFDSRPRRRKQKTALLRWNHQFEHTTLHASYLYYQDSFEVNAHTVQLELVQPLSASLSFVPSLSYYTQSAASFYVDPPGGDQEQLPLTPEGSYISLDQRLSAFGGFTGGAQLRWDISRHWSTDLKGAYHEERGDWRVSGDGSPGLTPFRYVAVQFGLSYRF